MSRWLFQNLGLKILALVIAVALWAYVGSRQMLDRRITLHLELTDVPAGMTVDSDVRTSISVLFSGRKDTVLDLDPEELKAVLSLRDVRPGQQEVVLRPKVQPLPPGVTPNSIPDIKVHLVPLNPPKKSKKGKR
jgi:YbbR domain-containing protein